MTEERTIINELIKIFDTKDIDFMGFEITKNNPLQYHHIIFKSNGGKTTIDNGALLTSSAHALFHKIVRQDFYLSKKITREFKKLNESKTKPSLNYYETINKYLEEYEEYLEFSKKNKKMIRVKNKNI